MPPTWIDSILKRGYLVLAWRDFMGQLMALHIYIYTVYIYNSDHDDHLGYPRLTTVKPLKNSCLDPRLSFSYQGVTVELPGARFLSGSGCLSWLKPQVLEWNLNISGYPNQELSCKVSSLWTFPIFFSMCGIFLLLMLNRWIHPPFFHTFPCCFLAKRRTCNIGRCCHKVVPHS